MLIGRSTMKLTMDTLVAAPKRYDILQRSATKPGGQQTVPPIVHEVLRSPGRPLDAETRAFMEPRLGHDFSQVRVHTDGKAAASARAVSASAYTVGRDMVFGTGQFAPATVQGRRLIAHELAHVAQQSNSSVFAEPRSISIPEEPAEIAADAAARQIYRGKTPKEIPSQVKAQPGTLWRDLALRPPDEVEDQPELSEERVRRAIRLNRASYDEESTRLIQDLVGVDQTGTFDEATVRAVAWMQERFGLEADGKVGPDTYDLLIRELQAELATPGTCLTLFQIDGPEPLALFPVPGRANAATIESRFFIRARFDPRCKCEDFEYRQYIAGTVILDDISGVREDLAGRFAIPGGGLPTTLREDGDVAIPVGVAGHRYGHRDARPNPSDQRDRYFPDRAAGCEYAGHDFPSLGPIPAAAGDAGDEYIWNMRFRGVIIRRGHGVIAEKYWSIRDTITIS